MNDGMPSGMVPAGEPAGELAEASPADEAARVPRSPTPADAPVALQIDQLVAPGDRGADAVTGLSLQVRRGEILGVAGVSGNGQRELLQAIVGQRPRRSGSVTVMGQPYHARRAENRSLQLRSLPEEPLRNACVGAMSVAQNMALRDFDIAPQSRSGLINFSAWKERARAWVAEYGIKTQGVDAPIQSLSGGNVQRAVLARELAGDINVLIAANPVFGLDFAAVAATGVPDANGDKAFDAEEFPPAPALPGLQVVQIS